MTRFAVELLPEAEQEFRDAFRSEVLDSIDGLADRADMWPANDDGIHFHVLDRFPYTVWYDLSGQLATVVAIAHQHRRPSYWKARG